MDLGAHERMLDQISALVEVFPQQVQATKQALAKLLAADPETFAAAGLTILKSSRAEAGSRYLAFLLAERDLLVPMLLNCGACKQPEAVWLAKSLVEGGIPMQPACEQALSTALKQPAHHDCAKRILRILDLLSAIGAQNRLSLFQTQLMEYPDNTVQSKTALLIGKAARSAAWIERHVQHRDSRVQANAVQALWGFDAGVSRALLRNACQSENNRVAGNAALGLYRIGDPAAIPILLEMTERPDARIQLSGLWAIGETQDPRFLPFLKERFASSEGRVRLAITRALSRIRQHQQAMESCGAIRICLSEVTIAPNGQRKLVFGLGSPRVEDLSGLNPTNFALWERDALVTNYSVRHLGSAAVLAAGFVVPQVPSSAPYRAALLDCLNRCLRLKRANDLWRIDRYSGGAGQMAAPSGEFYNAPALIRPVSMWHGFLTDRDVLLESVRSKGPVEIVAPAGAVLERQCHAMSKQAASRHVFLFLDQAAMPAFDDEVRRERIAHRVESERIQLHLFVAASEPVPAQIREFCQATGATLSLDPMDQIASAVERAYAHLLNGFELAYYAPRVLEDLESNSIDSRAVPVTLKVLSDTESAKRSCCSPPPASRKQESESRQFQKASQNERTRM